MRREGRLTSPRPHPSRPPGERAGGALRLLAGAALAAASLTASACESFAAPEPRFARIVLEGEGVEGGVEVVFSREFVVTGDGGSVRVRLFEADTTETALPYDVTRDVGEAERVFVEASALGEGVERFQMRILLDGEPAFTEIGPLARGAPFRFLYAFGETFTTGVVVF